jgi:zinc/manganese transport system substrate-binding protein
MQSPDKRDCLLDLLRTGVVALLLIGCFTAPASARPLRVAVTVPELGSLVKSVGGDEVDVTSFVRGAQDPHFIEARPSLIRVLSRADLFVTVGLGLEAGWVPPLLRNARNRRIQPGADGALDASRGIPLMGVQNGDVDRSMGDVHAGGNPHYLLDPVNGLRVVQAIAVALTRLRPERAELFEHRRALFERLLLVRLVGDEFVARHGASTVAAAALGGRIQGLAASSGIAPAGWLGQMAPHRGKSVIADHDLWPYFTARFGIKVAGFLEPLPGITPTTRHLASIVEQMKRESIRAILSAAYFHPRYAQKVAAATGATVVEMANQLESRKGVDDYLEMIDWNVRGVADAL